MEDAEATQNREVSGFILGLAAEVSQGRIQLPSYPAAATRVQHALSAEEIDSAAVVRAIGAEPALAVRVMQMANSALLNSMGRQVQDLRTAVGRVGYNMARTASVAFVVEQLRKSDELKPLRQSMATLWEQGITVAALAHVIARRCTRINPDVALLAGLLHGVGKLCILARLSRNAQLQQFPAACDRIILEWHSSVSRALLDNWQIAAEIGDAVQEFEDLDRELRGEICLSEILTAAMLLAGLRAGPDEPLATAGDIRAVMDRCELLWNRLGLDLLGCDAVMQDAEVEIKALRGVLDG